MKNVKKQEYRAIVDNETGNILGTTMTALPNTIKISKLYYEKISASPNKYQWKNGVITINPDYETIAEQREKERKGKLHITKFDFFKYICMPHDITYQELEEKIATNSYLSAAWNLCNHVYRGDETFCQYIKQFIPEITDEELDEIFEKYSE